MASAGRVFVALYTDEHVTSRLAADVRTRGYEALSAIEAGHIGWDDSEHLAFAAEREMALFTYDRRIVETIKQWTQAGREFWGVILSPQFSNRQYGTLLQWTLELLDEVTADDLRNALVFLQQFHR